jgi:peptidoglycan LD-endopeptidase CwlK
MEVGPMSDLGHTIRAIQRMLGATADGVMGPATAQAVWRALNRNAEDAELAEGGAEEEMDLTGLDARSLKNLATLDPKARGMFGQFLRLAKATAATLGCDYVLIGGNRTWAEQDALYAQGRTLPGARVTNARGGYSNHNFGIAGDCGVFMGMAYLDESNPRLAARVHKACSSHAARCGLEWGGGWNSIKDLPHYEVAKPLDMAQRRRIYAAKGSIL